MPQLPTLNDDYTIETYYEVVHLNDEGKRSGSFADQKADSVEEARKIITDKRTVRNPDASDDDKAYWARQRYGIQKVYHAVRFVEEVPVWSTRTVGVETPEYWTVRYEKAIQGGEEHESDFRVFTTRAEAKKFAGSVYGSIDYSDSEGNAIKEPESANVGGTAIESGGAEAPLSTTTMPIQARRLFTFKGQAVPTDAEIAGNRIAELEAIIKKAQDELVAQQDETDKSEIATCGSCGLSWNDAAISSRTPTPAGRCPFEYIHGEASELRRLKGDDVTDDDGELKTAFVRSLGEAPLVPPEVADRAGELGLVFGINPQTGNCIITFESNVNYDNSVTQVSVGTHKSEMELFTSPGGVPQMIEWVVADFVEHIGLTVDGKKITDADGVFEVPEQALVWLQVLGYDVSEISADDEPTMPTVQRDGRIECACAKGSECILHMVERRKNESFTESVAALTGLYYSATWMKSGDAHRVRMTDNHGAIVFEGQFPTYVEAETAWQRILPEVKSAITPEAVESYVSSPQHCPVCDGENIEGGDREVEDGRATQEMSCNHCDAEWVDVYKLEGITVKIAGVDKTLRPKPETGWHDTNIFSVYYEDIEVLIHREPQDADNSDIEIRVWRNGKNEDYPFAKVNFELPKSGPDACPECSLIEGCHTSSCTLDPDFDGTNIFCPDCGFEADGPIDDAGTVCGSCKRGIIERRAAV
jgi:hypothetical protein